MSVASRSPYLDLRALASVSHMRFITRQRIEGSFSGRHPSRRQGGAGEFVDFREYTGGEDLRRLDWKVYGRTGKAFVRLHQDETNLICTLAVDGSGSMQFGGRSNSDSRGSKLDYAKYLTTGLSHVIQQGQDQVGMAVLREAEIEYLPPGGTASHVARLQSNIEQINTAPASTLAPALRKLFERASRRGVLMLVSDFLADDLIDVAAALRLFRHRGWEVVALHLVHPHEEQLPDGMAFRFEGMENDGSLSCSPNEIRAAYQQRFAAHLTAVRQAMLSVGCDYRLVSTGIGYMQTLGGFLVERSG